MALLTVCLAPAAAEVPTLRPSLVYPPPAQNFTDDDGEVATDLSGIGCVQGSGARDCLVINDENQSAQVAKLGDGMINAGRRIRLIRKNADPAPLGQPPAQFDCSGGNAKFKDLDGEAVSYADGFYYVVGSHGCSRKKDKFQPSVFLLVRLAANGGDEVQATYRLAEALQTAPRVGEFFAKDLNEANGLNIEGLAVSGDDVFVGLRAPVIDGTAFIVRASAAAMFAGGAERKARGTLWEVKLGAGTGIRDLALLDDGRMLILAGPAQDQKLPFSLFLTSGGFGTPAVRIAELESVKIDGTTGKAEAVQILQASPGKLRIAVLFDSLENGAGREYEVPLP